MKCLSCKRNGKHFQNKICPTDAAKGVTKDDFKFKKRSIKFIGKSACEDAREYAGELRQSGTASHLRFRIVAHPDDAKIQCILTWVETIESSKENHGKV